MNDGDKRILVRDIVTTQVAETSLFRRRTYYDIIATILRTAERYKQKGIKTTELYMKAYISWGGFKGYIAFLLQKQLLEINREKGVTYRITEKGKRWLTAFEEFKAICSE
jgi:predicted transcriptional regulator